jgi:hypothetical protein
MKVDSRILIGLGVVVVGIIVYIIIKNSIKDDDKDDNTKTNKAKLDRLEKALKNAGIDTLEDFTETTSTAPEETGFTKSELFEIIDLYYPMSRCAVEMLFDDGLLFDGEIWTLGEKSDGKVVIIEPGRESSSLLRGLPMDEEDLFELAGLHSLVFVLENDNLNDWYNAFIGAVSLMSDQKSKKYYKGHLWAKYDKDHEDPYSTLVLYMDTLTPRGNELNKNTEVYVEAEWLHDNPVDENGNRDNYIKYTAKTQFERNKGKINELKKNYFTDKLYDYMVQCNSE